MGSRFCGFEQIARRLLAAMALAATVPSLSDARSRNPSPIPAAVIMRGEANLQSIYPRLNKQYVRVYALVVVDGRRTVVGAVHKPGVGIGYPQGGSYRFDSKHLRPGYYIVADEKRLPAGGVCSVAPCYFGIDYVSFDYETGELLRE